MKPIHVIVVLAVASSIVSYTQENKPVTAGVEVSRVSAQTSQTAPCSGVLITDSAGFIREGYVTKNDRY